MWGGRVVSTAGGLWITAENTTQSHPTKGRQGSSGIFPPIHMSVAESCTGTPGWNPPMETCGCLQKVSLVYLVMASTYRLQADHRQYLLSSVQITCRALVLVMLESFWGKYLVSQGIFPVEVFQGFLCLAYELTVHQSPVEDWVGSPPPCPISSTCTGILRFFRKFRGLSCVFCSFINCKNIAHYSFLVSPPFSVKKHTV